MYLAICGEGRKLTDNQYNLLKLISAGYLLD